MLVLERLRAHDDIGVLERAVTRLGQGVLQFDERLWRVESHIRSSSLASGATTVASSERVCRRMDVSHVTQHASPLSHTRQLTTTTTTTTNTNTRTIECRIGK